MLVSPISNQTILFGYVTGGVVRAVLVGIIVTILSLFFTHLAIHNIFAVVSVTLLTAVLFSLLGFINGVYAKRFDDVECRADLRADPAYVLGWCVLQHRSVA